MSRPPTDEPDEVIPLPEPDWKARAHRLSDYLLGMMQVEAQRLHHDLCAAQVDLDDAADRAAGLAETLRVLAEA